MEFFCGTIRSDRINAPLGQVWSETLHSTPNKPSWSFSHEDHSKAKERERKCGKVNMRQDEKGKEFCEASGLVRNV